MERVKTNLAALLKVKTIVTILLTIVFCILALTGTISGADFLQIFAIVITFYFCSQNEKSATMTYTGPQHGVNIMPEGGTEAIIEDTVDSATANEVHPPDPDTMQRDIIG